MPVEIDLDLDWADLNGSISAIKRRLNSLEDEYEITVDIDRSTLDRLEQVARTFDEYTEKLTSELGGLVDRLEDLEIEKVQIREGGGGDSGGDTGSDSGDDDDRNKTVRGLIDKFWKEQPDILDDFGRELKKEFDFKELRKSLPDVTKDRLYAQRKAFSLYGGSGDGRRAMGGWTPGSMDLSRINAPSLGAREGLDYGSANKLIEAELRDRESGMKSILNTVFPSMNKWWRLIGAAIPALGALGAQGLGAAAMGGGALAGGGALVGLGLFGHGSTMEGASRGAREQMKELKRGLFETFSPVAQLFAPIQAEFFEYIPRRLRSVAQEMRGLTAYRGLLFDMFDGLASFTGELVEALIANEEIISDVTDEFLRLAGGTVIDFLNWLVAEAYANKQAFLELGAVFKLVLATLYNLFNAVTKVLITFSWAFEIIHTLSQLLNNDLVIGLAASVGLFSLFAYGAIGAAKAVAALSATIGAGMIPGITTALQLIQAYVFNALTAVGVTYALANAVARLVSVITLGLGTILAIYTGIQTARAMKNVNKLRKQANANQIPTGSGGGDTYITNRGDNISLNVEGDVSSSSEERLKTTLDRYSREKDSRNYGSTNSTGVGPSVPGPGSS